VFYLEGPSAAAQGAGGRINRAPHFAGGRMRAKLAGLGDRYAVEMWFSNYLPTDARTVTGCLFSRGNVGAAGASDDCLTLSGPRAGGGKLVFSTGDRDEDVLRGTTDVGVKTWNHVVLCRSGRHITVYLNGRRKAEIDEDTAPGLTAGADEFFIGGRGDGVSSFEGRIDEVAIYGRTLSPDEMARHYEAAGFAATRP
jgi:hypothetical protein